jgi:hypothetical protein
MRSGLRLALLKAATLPEKKEASTTVQAVCTELRTVALLHVISYITVHASAAKFL